MLPKTRYSEKTMYMGKYIYPDMGSVKVDWEVLQYTFAMLSHTDDIDEYFYFLLFSKHLAEEADIDYLNQVLPEIYQHRISSTDNFDVRGNLGSIVPGYNLIIPKKHILSMSALNEQERLEYISLLQAVRKEYQDIWGQVPIIFEHGTNNGNKPKASSVTHAHSHIVNHHYTDEQRVIDYLGLQEVSSLEEMFEKGCGKNYISYISPENRYFIAEPKQEESQIMRRFIAEDVGIPEAWNRREYPHLENSLESVKQFVLHNKKEPNKAPNLFTEDLHITQ